MLFHINFDRFLWVLMKTFHSTGHRFHHTQTYTYCLSCWNKPPLLFAIKVWGFIPLLCYSFKKVSNKKFLWAVCIFVVLVATSSGGAASPSLVENWYDSKPWGPQWHPTYSNCSLKLLCPNKLIIWLLAVGDIEPANFGNLSLPSRFRIFRLFSEESENGDEIRNSCGKISCWEKGNSCWEEEPPYNKNVSVVTFWSTRM